MCGHKQIGIWEVSKITVVDSNDVVNHCLDDRYYQHSHGSYLTILMACHSYLTGVTSHGDVTPSGIGHRVSSHRK